MFSLGVGGTAGCCGYDQEELTSPAHWKITDQNNDDIHITVATMDGTAVPVTVLESNPADTYAGEGFIYLMSAASHGPVGSLYFEAAAKSIEVIYCSPSFGEITRERIYEMRYSPLCGDANHYPTKEPDCAETDSKKRTCAYVLEPTSVAMDTYVCNVDYDEATKESVEHCSGDHDPVYQVHIEMTIQTEEKFISEKTYCEGIG
jgi:hypothetical protein